MSTFCRHRVRRRSLELRNGLFASQKNERTEEIVNCQWMERYRDIFEENFSCGDVDSRLCRRECLPLTVCVEDSAGIYKALASRNEVILL